MSDNGLNEYKTALIVGGIIFVVAIAMLLGIGDYGFIAAFFLALLLGLLSAIVYHLAFVPSAAGGASHASPQPPASASGASASASAPAAMKEADEPAEQKAAADKAAADAAAAEAAKQKAEAEAAAAAEKAEAEAAAEKAAAEAAAEKAAADAARQKAEADAAAEKAAAEVKANEAKAEAEAASAGQASDSLGEDYDGDGVREGVNEGTRPGGLDGPRGGAADDLKLIKGVGPKLEALLNRLGFWHFDQVASWSADEVAWVDANLEGFKGRVSRDEWVQQARVLASGGETEFSKRVEDGDVY